MVAGERRRPAASSAAEMVMGSPPIARRQSPPLYQPAGPQGCVYVGDRAISPRLHDAQAGGSSASSPLVVQGRRLAGVGPDDRNEAASSSDPGDSQGDAQCRVAWNAEA